MARRAGRVTHFLDGMMQIVPRMRPSSDGNGRQVNDVLHIGHLELRFDINRASGAVTVPRFPPVLPGMSAWALVGAVPILAAVGAGWCLWRQHCHYGRGS